MKTKTLFICQQCGAQSPRWTGKCSSCDSWNSYVEESVNVGEGKGQAAQSFYRDKPILLSDVKIEEEKRYLTKIGEFDRVMGGGILPGSVTLIGGDPGIGKSTLSLQVACILSQQGYKVFYVSGEESVKQTKYRRDRLNYKDNSNLYIVNQVDLDLILSDIKSIKPSFVIIDSIQVLYYLQIASAPGSVSQVRECSAMLTHTAKTMGIAMFIVGHVTKDGAIAGPRVLEHIVDTVLYFEGERYSTYRILRANKNRFGSTNEIGVFEMSSGGLKEVANPSAIFLAERPQNSSGSVVAPILEGTRPLLVEIQGLVSRSNFGIVRQKAQGFDANRLALLVAVLEKRLGLNLQDKDIFLNVVGGIKIVDPSADLAVVIAIASALLDKPIAFDTIVIGEVGLSSEIRSVGQIEQRLMEATKLGFKKCLIPRHNMKQLTDWSNRNIEIIPVETVQQALDYFR